MRRLHLLHLALLFLLIPRVASSFDLKWITGASDSSFTEATRCVLILETDPSEASLPAEWRLLWLADSSGVHFVTQDSLAYCAVDTAMISALEPPSTPADSTAHIATAQFCSDASSTARAAYYVLDQPGGSRGRLKVVALDPADPDSLTVMESNEVTYNGGISGDFGPVLLRAFSTHETAELRVTAIGAGLASTEAIRVGAPDNLWSVPLSVTQRSNSSITATANVYVPLPESVVQAGTATALSDQVALPADDIIVVEPASAGTDTILYRDPNPSVYPKDFAFYFNTIYDPTDPAHPWKGVFHLLYIRNRAGEDSIIAHAWTYALGEPWSLDSVAFRPSGTGWDSKRVWAPSIQRVGNLTYMFYTGIDDLGNQSIGYVTTEVLGVTNDPFKDRPRIQAYTANQTGWAHLGGVLQFRDPFIMPDPDVTNYPGRYLLFNAGRDRNFPANDYYTIGVARNAQGTLDEWVDLRNYEATDHDHLPVPNRLESPMVIQDSLSGAWRIFVANGDYDPLGYESTIFLTQMVGDSLTDIRASSWPQTDSLYYYSGEDADVIGWQACEHLQIGQAHFFAAFVGPDGIGISRMHWDPSEQKFVLVYPDLTAVPTDHDLLEVRFFVADLHPGAGSVRLVIESPRPIAPEIIVYDIGGRRIRELVSGRVVHGRTELTWDRRDDSGRPVATGAYFARMTGAGPAQVARVPVIR
jgi:hypothetical protein